MRVSQKFFFAAADVHIMTTHSLALALIKAFSVEAGYPIYAGPNQQDAHEFFSVLLDAVHEDLNRVERGDEGSTSKKKKAARENGDEKKRLTSFAARSPEKTAKVMDGDSSAETLSEEVAPAGTPGVGGFCFMLAHISLCGLIFSIF